MLSVPPALVPRSMSPSAEPTLSALLDTLPQATLVLDSTGLVQVASHSACARLGRSADALNQLPFVDMVHDDDRQLIQQSLLGCAAKGGTMPLEFRLIQPDQQYSVVRWTLRPCNPSPEGGVWLVLTPEAADSPEQRREFLSHAGHEMRNPLSSILAFAEALQEGVNGPLNPAQSASLQAIRENVQRQLELINQFVELGHLEANAVQLEQASVRLTDVLDQAMAAAKDMARSRSIRIKTDLRPPTAEMNADSKRLAQIVSEILVIGTISCPVGGELQLDLALANADAVLDIRMQGGLATTGFVLNCQPVLMDEPARKALARVRKLRPIGFALLEGLVKLHRGSFSFQASTDGGMGIRVLLNLNPNGKPTNRTLPLEPHPMTDVPLTGGPMGEAVPSPLVLLADDQPALSAITRDYLESVGLRVEVAFDGQEAVHKTFQLRPDLIMMDVQMPVMDGLEAIRLIRQCSDPRLAQVPIISLSGLAVAGDMEKCLSAGATAYLAKPFGVQQLHRAIRSLIAIP